MTSSSVLDQKKLNMSTDFLAAASREAVEVMPFPGSDETPHISVVVPTYNHRRYVVDTVESLSRLQGIPFEVVIVDDGSTDGSFAAILDSAAKAGLPGRLVRLQRNRGRSVARNVGINHARADLIAFTDSDCLPTSCWLEAGVGAFTDARTGIVQGPTEAYPAQRQPFFSHFIEIQQFDGTFSTCNVFYRKQSIKDAGGFDPGVIYWEDVDLGWRARRAGWQANFAPGALVYHQVIPLSPQAWLRWPLHFRYMPAKVARYPEYRRHLFARYWVSADHAALSAALLGVLAAPIYWPAALLSLPYIVNFLRRHGFHGRWPPAKIALHLWWDLFGWACLAVSSVKHRALVL